MKPCIQAQVLPKNLLKMHVDHSSLKEHYFSRRDEASTHLINLVPERGNPHHGNSKGKNVLMRESKDPGKDVSDMGEENELVWLGETWTGKIIVFSWFLLFLFSFSFCSCTFSSPLPPSSSLPPLYYFLFFILSI
jgi:hypothetical protein